MLVATATRRLPARPPRVSPTWPPWPQVLELLDEYGLSKDDFDSIMEFQLLSGASAKPDISALAPAVKSALTRAYNKAHQGVKKGVSATRADKERFTEEGEEEEGRSEEEEEEEEEGAAAFVKAAPKKAGKSKAAGKARA